MARTVRRAPSRWIRWTLASVVLLVAATWFGVTTAKADRSLGPHEARYEVTTSSEVVVDFGPLGTLRLDSPAGPLGVSVTIGEIPAELTQIEQANTIEGLAADLDSYLQFFSTPEATIREVVRALAVDAARRTGVALVVLAVLAGGLWFLAGRARRDELASAVLPRSGAITVGVLVVALVGGTFVSDSRSRSPAGPTSPVFAGTALEGARITGRLAGVIDTYGAQLLEIYHDNERFYAQARTSLQVAWGEQAAIDQRIAAASSSQGTAGLPGTEVVEPTQSAEPDLQAESESDRSAPDDGTPDDGTLRTVRQVADEDLVSFLVVSDLHCNMSMTPLIRDIAERAGVSAILDAGDTTMNGTAVERVCIDAFADARPDGVEMVVADGNHDSALVADAQRSHGMTVLDGSVVEVDGVRILGDRDPNETRVGAGTSSRGESAADMAERLDETACEQDIDLLLIHTPSVGDAAMRSGCAPFQVSGHTHTRYDPIVRGYSVRYVNGSTAGALSGQPTVGPLRGIAEMTVLRFDPTTRRFVDWKLVEVFPDATAQVSRWRAMPVAPEPDAESTDAESTGDESTGDETTTGDAPGTEAPTAPATEPTEP